VAGDKVIGVVGLGNIEPDNFTNEQIQWAEVLAGQAAMAIQNAWLFEQVRSSSERLQSLARKLVELQESERYHIARELHDEAGQALSSLKMNLGRLEQDPDCPEHIRRRLLDLKSVADGVLEELHRLAMDLRPAALDHLGLVAALEQLAGHLNSERLSVQFKAVGFDGGRLPRDVETSLYRIVQEALTNILRHAHASDVGILLERSGGRVKLFVEDDGVGFTPDQVENGEQLGLVGMRERAEMFGGSLSIESSPGSGTSIIVEVPDADSYSHHR
jgi:signal transduction histidine kinase